jgi:hypothetical protein
MKAALITLGLIGVVAIFLTMHVSRKNIEVRREQLALDACRKAAVEKLAFVEKAVSNTIVIAGQGEAYIPVASNLVVGLLGEAAFPKPEKPPARVAPGANPRTTDENPAGLMSREEIERRRAMSAGATPQEPPARRVEPPRQRPEPAREANRITEDNPGGLMTREEIERRRGIGGGRSPEPPPVAPPEPKPEPVRHSPPPVQAPPAEPQAAAVKPIGPEEPIMIMFKQVMSQVATLQETAQKAAEIGGQAQSLYEDVRNAMASSNAQPVVAAMDPLVEESAKLREGALPQLEGIKRKCADMGKEKVRVEEDRKVRAEAERKRMEEESRRALVAAEIQRGEEAHRAVLPSIRKFQFKEALQTAKGIQDLMKTDEGRKAAQPAIDLCARLVSFKAFLIERLAVDPFKWGWGEGAAARDIVGATEEGVRHSTGFAGWPDIGTKQLVKIIERYVNDGKLGAKVQGENALGAALLLRDLGAADAAEVFARRAAQHMPSLDGELTRLK